MERDFLKQSISDMVLGDQLFFFTTMLYTSTVLGSLFYDLSLPKTGTTIVYTGGTIYALISLPVILYSSVRVLWAPVAENFAVELYTQKTVEQVYAPYFIIYIMIVGFVNYLYLS